MVPYAKIMLAFIFVVQLGFMICSSRQSYVCFSLRRFFFNWSEKIFWIIVQPHFSITLLETDCTTGVHHKDDWTRLKNSFVLYCNVHYHTWFKKTNRLRQFQKQNTFQHYKLLMIQTKSNSKETSNEYDTEQRHTYLQGFLY